MSGWVPTLGESVTPTGFSFLLPGCLCSPQGFPLSPGRLLPDAWDLWLSSASPSKSPESFWPDQLVLFLFSEPEVTFSSCLRPGLSALLNAPLKHGSGPTEQQALKLGMEFI